MAKEYPKPLFNHIVEPFAGAAYYALRYFENEVTLIDKNPHIIAIWHFLQQASDQDIAKLPLLPAGHRIERNDFDSDGEYYLMRFLIVQAAFGGNNIVSKWGAMRLAKNISRVRSHLFKIKHWRIQLGSYNLLDNVQATWFIDPPYLVGGHKYPMSNRAIDYCSLAEWCRSRNGQVIVCENTNADWLPFTPLKKLQGIHAQSVEAIWTNNKLFTTQEQLCFF